MNGFSDAVSITAISTKRKSDEHLLFLHRRLRREGGTLTKQKEPRLETALVFLVSSDIGFHRKDKTYEMETLTNILKQPSRSL